MVSKEVKKHYASIIGVHPNFIKPAVFFRGARNNSHVKFTLIHTGQHFDDNVPDETTEKILKHLKSRNKKDKIQFWDGKVSDRIFKCL